MQASPPPRLVRSDSQATAAEDGPPAPLPAEFWDGADPGIAFLLYLQEFNHRLMKAAQYYRVPEHEADCQCLTCMRKREQGRREKDQRRRNEKVRARKRR